MKITILFFDENKKCALICKSRWKEKAPAHMCWNKMVKLNGAWIIISLQRVARRGERLICYSVLYFLHNALIGWSCSHQSLWDFAAGEFAVASTLVPPALCTLRSEAVAYWELSLISVNSGKLGKRRHPHFVHMKTLAWDQLNFPLKTATDGRLELSACYMLAYTNVLILFKM